MASPVRESEQTRILELHAAGLARNDIARQTGRSQHTVSRVVAAAGLTFARSAQTQAATRAKQIDNRARRAQLETDLLEDAARLRQQLWLPTTVFNFGGKDNTYAEHRLDQPDFAGQLSIVRAVGTAVDKSVRLAEVDKGHSDTEAGRSLIGDFFKSVALAYHVQHQDDPANNDSASCKVCSGQVVA